MSAYRRDFDESKYVFFHKKNDELLNKHNKIWDKANKVNKKGFDSELVYNEKYIKTKIKFYEGKINTNVHGNKVPKEH